MSSFQRPGQRPVQQMPQNRRVLGNTGTPAIPGAPQPATPAPVVQPAASASNSSSSGERSPQGQSTPPPNSTDNALLGQLASANTKDKLQGAGASQGALGTTAGLGGNGLTGLATGAANGERAPAGAPASTPSSGERATPDAAATADPAAQADTANDQMWKDIMAQWQGETGNYDRIGNEVESRAARRAGAANAAAGHGMGGGWASGMGQAAIAGESKRLDLEQQHAQRGLELQMTHLQDQLKRAEAAKDRQQQIDIQNMINTTMLEMENIRQGATPGAEANSGSKTASSVNVAQASKDPASRQQALQTFDTNSVWEQNQQADAAFQQAPPEFQAGYQNIVSSKEFKGGANPAETEASMKRWAYRQFLTTGQWPTAQAAFEATAAWMQGQGMLDLQ